MPFPNNLTLFKRAAGVSGSSGTARLGLQVLSDAAPTSTTDPAAFSVPIGLDTAGRARSINTSFSANWFVGIVPRAAGVGTISGTDTTVVIALGFSPDTANAIILSSVTVGTGAPDTKSVRASVSAANLTFTADAAPGAGTSVLISWAVY